MAKKRKRLHILKVIFNYLKEKIYVYIDKCSTSILFFKMFTKWTSLQTFNNFMLSKNISSQKWSQLFIIKCFQ